MKYFSQARVGYHRHGHTQGQAAFRTRLPLTSSAARCYKMCWDAASQLCMLLAQQAACAAHLDVEPAEAAAAQRARLRKLEQAAAHVVAEVVQVRVHGVRPAAEVQVVRVVEGLLPCKITRHLPHKDRISTCSLGCCPTAALMATHTLLLFTPQAA